MSILRSDVRREISRSVPIYFDVEQPIETRVEDLLSRLKLEEKISLICADSKFSTAAIPQLGVPRRWLSDGPHGVREEVGPHTWQPAGRTDDFATYMPVLIALTATWNPLLAESYGQTVGAEARKRGKDILLGPGINICRTPLGGRNYEYMGEDPFLAGQMAAGYVRGIQSQDVAACPKHFALNNQEAYRKSVNVEVDERALREIYLPAFEMAIKEGGALCVMAAYNQFRGMYCAQNDYLLNQILKNEWGFNGVVMSDWGGVQETHAAAMGGLDLEMGTEKPYEEFYFSRPLLEEISRGHCPMAVLDEKARRNLRVMFATRMLDPKRKTGSINTREHQLCALRVAEESMVLLKNENAFLPLNANKIKSVAVIGENAIRRHAYGGDSARIKAFYETTPFDGLMNRVGSSANICFSLGYNQTSTDTDLIERAVAAAVKSEIAIIFAGLNRTDGLDTEGFDRADLKLPYHQDELIRNVASVNPHTIVVLISGGPVKMNGWLNKIPAVVQAWYPGMEGGNAIARILFGDANPSGKLPCTFPKQLSDSPAHALHAYPGGENVHYKESIFVGYRWFDSKQIAPLFPFGHGLSYTQFDYSNLQIDSDGLSVRLQFDLTNIGKCAGAETAQVYVRQANASVPRPEKELKGFIKILLQPDESQTISIALDRRAFCFHHEQQGWIAEKGDFVIMVGSSSRDIRLQGIWTLPKTITLSAASSSPDKSYNRLGNPSV